MTKLTTRLIIATFAMCAIYFSLAAARSASGHSDASYTHDGSRAECASTTASVDHD